jgi:hypothetical protein
MLGAQLLCCMPNWTQDFDFLAGKWNVHNRYLKGRLRSSTEWIEFDGTSEVQPLLNGLGNLDRYSAQRDGKLVKGITVRLLNPDTGEWSLYWADNVRPGALQMPMIGKFQGDTGEFFGEEEVDGKKVLCRFRWIRGDAPRWEQAFSDDGGASWEVNWVMTMTRPCATDFPVIEFRRYTVQEAERAHFAQYFETYFMEAFQQLGAMVLGQFLDRENPAGFTWIRGFRNMDERASVNQAFYDGPLWKEHSKTMNDRLVDHTNVLLLRPLRPETAISCMPTVDCAGGIVVAQIFRVKADQVDGFGETVFASYRATGAREAGILVTLDVPNNFPRLPFRTDGPYVVWLGIVKDAAMLDELRRLAGASFEGLRDEPELAILDPTRRSRLRWLA